MATDITLAKSAADVIGSVDDLLIQILLCLPVKSLMRFKLVSKQWKSLITSHRFSLLRYPPPNPVLGLILPQRTGSAYTYIPLDGKNPTEFPYRDKKSIEQSCNGLLLCCSSERSYRTLALGTLSVLSCCVYNPTTKCSAQLRSPGLVHGLNLAFDPAKSPFYKVVCVRGSGFARDRPFQIEVYSSEFGVWRTSGEPFGAKAEFGYGVYWNSSIHWITHERKELVYFNLDEEALGKAKLPATTGSGRDDYFGESRGHLHIVVNRVGRVKFDVYEMKRDYSEWFVKYRVDLTTAAAAEPQNAKLLKISRYNAWCSPVYSLVRVEGKGSFVVLWALDERSRVPAGFVIRLDLDCNTYEEIFDMSFPFSRDTLPRVWEHVESLASV